MNYGIINTQSKALKDDNLIGLLINNRYNGTTMTNRNNTRHFVRGQSQKLLKPYSYRPIINFGGVTECYSEIPKDILKFIEGLRKTSQMQLIA